MAESATEVKLFGKWSLDDVEVSDLALVVRLKLKIRQLNISIHNFDIYLNVGFPCNQR